MAELSKILRSVEGGGLMFWCPGCDGAHMVRVGDGPGPRWGYNGNPDAPTFTPSILVNAGRLNPMAHVCHSFVTDGRIQFLNDCTHHLAGQTAEIPAWDSPF
ncbi:DUF6527 family protein [Azospirillum canadense]|uniref:DUF6527 family protein n=1 Tax=Azospirillum canadense TaxID=403962 RepID=UPI0022267F16|nr:DUF6527 family protein [Azospirillum canadense]MCW2239237.1 hypothetical protein [Azospirillum canadense]